MSDLASLSVEEIFRLLESNNPDVVSEIQRLFHENLSETREGWLVSGLYDYYTSTGSANGLKLLLNVKVSSKPGL
jgi:tuberous sclerosis protein 1